MRIVRQQQPLPSLSSNPFPRDIPSQGYGAQLPPPIAIYCL
jgi:hypothetical protein